MPSSSSYTVLHETEAQVEHIIEICKDIGPALHDLCCIYKVPPHLRKVNDGAYEPHLISIGPFHYKIPVEQKLQAMHKQKQRYFLSFWERVTNKKALAKYKDFLKEDTDKIRHCYSELDNNSLMNENDDEFVNMILLDSVFILELFLRNSDESERENDYMFTTSWICKGIQRDLMLLENQLPMFVLEKLYGTTISKENCPSFLELAVKYYLDDYFPDKITSDDNRKEAIIKNCHSCEHLNDLIRCFYLPRDVPDDRKELSQLFAPNGGEKCSLKTATRLKEAGVDFVADDHNGNLLDISFEKLSIFGWFLGFGFACLKIPQFEVTRTTECVLRNLIALEQCHYSDQPFICNYVSLIESLINTKHDVALLVSKEVIVHELGSDQELADMINGLCEHVVLTRSIYGRFARKVNNHHDSKWKSYMSTLKSVYFRDPWRLSSTVVGVFVFIFAILNFLDFIGLYHPKNK